MKIVIVGAGSLGCLFYALLSRKKENNIWLLDRKIPLVRSIKKNGIKISGISRIKIPPFKVQISNSAKNIGCADLIIILVKSYDTASAIEKVIPCIGNHTITLTLQNGLNNLKTIKKSLRSHSFDRLLSKVFVGTTSYAATAVNYGKIVHTGIGETIIARHKMSDLNSARKIQKLFEGVGMKTTISDDINSVVWSKLLINAAINPVGAIFNLTNGEILKNEFARGIMIETANEIASFCKARKIKLLYDNPVAKVISVCKKTAANKNSMLQDILNGKPTEIDSLNGAILREFEAYKNKLKIKNLQMPYTAILYKTIKVTTS